MNKSQAEKKVHVFQNPTGRSPFDHFLDQQSMPRLFITINRWLIQTLLLLILFNSLLRGSGWLRAYQNDYVIDNYVETAVIWRTHNAPKNNIICTKNSFILYSYNDSKCLLRFFIP